MLATATTGQWRLFSGKNLRLRSSKVRVRCHEISHRNLELQDDDDCAKLYVCGLASRDPKAVSSEAERQVLKMFPASTGSVNIAASKSAFDLAASLGRVSRSGEACKKRFSKCN